MFPLAALSPLLGRKHRGAKELEGDGSSFQSVSARLELKERVQATLGAAQVNLNFPSRPNMGVPQYHLDLCQFRKEKHSVCSGRVLKLKGKIPHSQCILTLFLLNTLKTGQNGGEKTNPNHWVSFRSGFGFTNKSAEENGKAASH